MTEEKNNLPSQDVADSERSGDRRLSTCSASSDSPGYEGITVKDLIRILQGLPPDRRVVFQCKEDSCDDIGVSLCSVALHKNTQILSRYGEHDLVADGIAEPAVLIGYPLPNVKEHATPLAGASVETGGEG